MKQAPEVRIGDSVFYYRQCSATAPLAAIVINVFNENFVSLSVYEAGYWVEKASIHRKDCDIVKDNPAIGNKFGVWDFRDGPEAREAMKAMLEAYKTAKDGEIQKSRNAGGRFQPKEKVAE